MYFLLASLIYINVIIQVVIGQQSKQLQGKEDENGWVHEPVLQYSENMSENKKSKSKKHQKHKPAYPIEEVNYKGANVYKCNGQIFHSLEDANKCLLKLKKEHPTSVRTTRRQLTTRRHSKRGSKKDKQNNHSNQNGKILIPNIKLPNDSKRINEVYPKNPRPPNHFHKKITRRMSLPNLSNNGKKPNLYDPPLKRPPFTDRYQGFTIKSYLSKSDFSNTIYNKIWYDCSYKYYWKDNYKSYKMKVLANINLLRASHRANPLHEIQFLDNLAQEHANRMARKNALFTLQSVEYGITVGVIYYPAGSLIVTKWYDERRHYKFGSNHPRPGTQMLTQMLWGESSLVGIGVARNGDFLFLACLYHPRGNINGQYKKNVLNKRSKWLFGK